jgi:photosystem II stability/assembly factor-like uncharacterized protein
MKTLLQILFFFLLVTQIFFGQWVQMAGPSGISTFASSGTNIFAGGCTIGVYISTDQGITWNNINSNLRDSCISCLAVIESHILAGTPSGIYRSTDIGISWTALDTITIRYVQDIDVNGTNIFAGTSFGVFLSTDNGTNWTAMNNGLTETFVVDLAANGSNIFAATQNGVFLSTNSGANWSSAGLDGFGVGHIAICNNSLFASTYGTNGTVFLSTDNGTTWSVSDLGLTEKTVLDFEVYETNIFSSTLNFVFLSSNNGLSWTAVDEGLTAFYYMSLGVNEPYLFAGTMGLSVWRRPLSEMITDVEDESSKIPTKFLLSQNYPNPFNPSTKIIWQSPLGSWQALKVYDVLGNEVVKLVDEYKPAGHYEVDWYASSLSSGVYFYQLKTENYSETKKMILMR